jgi:radical SAM protein with 4Fe4S-binding SPASM domain
MVFWETTIACNLRCAHCRRGEGSPDRSSDELTTGEAASLIDELADYGVRVLVLSGGEPLLREDIYDLAARGVDAGMQVALATNGTLLDAASADLLQAAGVARVSVSLDAVEAELHDRFRNQAGAFAAAVAGAHELAAAGLPFQINMTVTRHNAERLDDMRQLAQDLGAAALHLFMLVPVGCGLQIADEEQVDAQMYETVLNWVLDRQEDTDLEIRATCAPHHARIAHQRGKHAAGGSGCLAGRSIAFVSYDGKLYGCGYLPVEAGDLRVETFRHAWENSDVFGRLRDPAALGGKCGACGYRRLCAGCRARAYGTSGDIMAEEPFCVFDPGDPDSTAAMTPARRAATPNGSHA